MNKHVDGVSLEEGQHHEFLKRGLSHELSIGKNVIISAQGYCVCCLKLGPCKKVLKVM